MGIYTSALQLPEGFNDFRNFSCDTVMGASCARDMVSRVQTELDDIVRNGILGSHANPCNFVAERLNFSPLPATCEQPFRTKVNVSDQYRFQDGVGKFEAFL